MRFTKTQANLIVAAKLSGRAIVQFGTICRNGGNVDTFGTREINAARALVKAGIFVQDGDFYRSVHYRRGYATHTASGRFILKDMAS
jgi:hypothetical protein